MTSSQKALALYGPLAAGTLICAAVAGLGIFRVIQPLAGEAKSVCLVAVAVAMAIQGAALFPRKWESRLIVKPHALAAGSLMLLAGAALLLALLFSGCSRATATPHARQIINFYGSESTGTLHMFGADVPGPLAAQDLPWETQVNQSARLPGEAILRAFGAEIAAMRAHPALASVRRAELTVAIELATIMKVKNEEDV